ncbi:MAG: hypothetical protein ACYS30_20540 [Planctomycetota bacterium]|jgi:hypothetical protein
MLASNKDSDKDAKAGQNIIREISEIHGSPLLHVKIGKIFVENQSNLQVVVGKKRKI